MSQHVPADYAPSFNIVYFPQLGWFIVSWPSPDLLTLRCRTGFLICIPMLKEWQETGIAVIDGWTFQASLNSRATVIIVTDDLEI